MDCCKPSVFSIEDFLDWFPEFSDPSKYDRAAIQGCGRRAKMHIGPFVCGMSLSCDRIKYAEYLMAAHILSLDSNGNGSGSDGDGANLAGAVFKATVGSVQVESSKQNSFTSDDWNLWLGKTKYGQELLAFLDMNAQGGIFLNTPIDSVRDLP